MSAVILVFAVAAGVALSNSVVHCALGIQRPRSVKHLTFAALMLFIFPFQIATAGLYMARSPLEAVAMGRAGVALAVVIVLLYARFVELYAEAVVPRWVAQAHIVASVGWLLYDLLSPWGLLFAALPVTVFVPRGGPDVLFVRTPAIGLLWQGFNALTIIWGIAAGVRMARAGRRRAGMAVVVGSACVLSTVFFDIAKGVLAESWPYMGGFGIVVLALVLSAQLAADFRAGEKRLADMVAAALVLSDLLNTPLQTLEVGLETLNVDSEEERARVLRLKRAVAKLAEVGRQLQLRPPLRKLITPSSK